MASNVSLNLGDWSAISFFCCRRSSDTKIVPIFFSPRKITPGRWIRSLWFLFSFYLIQAGSYLREKKEWLALIFVWLRLYWPAACSLFSYTIIWMVHEMENHSMIVCEQAQAYAFIMAPIPSFFPFFLSLPPQWMYKELWGGRRQRKRKKESSHLLFLLYSLYYMNLWWTVLTQRIN